MRLRTDERGVTVQIGTVLLFAVLVILLSIYQASVVPQQNEQVEFTHNQAVQSQLQDLRDDLLRTAATGSGGSASVALGTQYPVRAVFVNPAPPSGTLRTTPPANLTVENATATGETGDYWTGSARNFSTRGLTYDPLYHVYQNPPTTVYDAGVLYNRFDSANRTLAGQRLVDGNSISLVALNGSLSKSSSSTTTVDLRAVSAATRTVAVGNESSNVSVLVPTTLPADEWRGLLSAEMDETASNPDRYVRAVEEVPDRSAVRLVLEPATYELELAKVGVGTDVTDTDAHYVTDVRGDNASVAENSGRDLVVEVRDRFDNPVSGATVNMTLDSGLGGDAVAAQGQRGDQLTDLTTDEEGRVTIRYDAPENFDGSNRDVAVRVGMASVPPAGGDFDPGTRTNLSYNLTAVNTDGSGLTDDSDGPATYSVNWTDAVGDGLRDCDAQLTRCTVNADDGIELDLTATVTDGTDPLAQAAVDYAVNDSALAEVVPTGETTDAAGRNETTLRLTPTNGTVTVYAASGDDVDPIRVRIVNPDPAAESDSPTIERFIVDDQSNCPSGQTPCPGNSGSVQYGIDWAVSDTGGSGLSSVELSLRNQNGQTVTTQTVGVSGDSASGTATLTPDSGNGNYGEEYTVRIEATDQADNTETASVTDTADGQGGGGAGVDPGFAYQDADGDGVYEPDTTDSPVSEAQLDGTFTAGDGNDLVVPDSTDGRGSLDVNRADWTAESILLDANVTSRNDVRLTAESGSLDLADRTVDNYAGGSGSGGVTLDAAGSVAMAGTDVRTKGTVSIDGGKTDLTGTVLDNYVGGSGSGGVSITSSGSLSAADAVVDTKGDISVEADAVTASNAVFDNYQGGSGSGSVTVDVAGSFAAEESVFATKNTVQVTAASADLDGASIDNYQGGSGSGAITVSASGGSLSVRDADLLSKRDVSLSGDSLDAARTSVNNFVGGSGSGSISLTARTGDAVLNRTELNTARSSSATVSQGTLFVAEATIEERGRSGTLQNTESATVVGEPRRGRVS
ncbi:hypothetical protein [Halorussus salinus]|uniref:hypothetical protein n=1 Tax=Halorussus salinus TaxID=1364935 RepID=UPI00109238F1|nr:hypothetical protein [Halorussus salinus]